MTTALHHQPQKKSSAYPEPFPTTSKGNTISTNHIITILQLFLTYFNKMKFSAFIIAAVAGSTSAFAPASFRAPSAALSAATLEAPPAADVKEAVEEPMAAPAAMEMEKDFPVAGNFVKDSDRVMP
jgi:hypothetical protein